MKERLYYLLDPNITDTTDVKKNYICFKNDCTFNKSSSVVMELFYDLRF